MVDPLNIKKLCSTPLLCIAVVVCWPPIINTGIDIFIVYRVLKLS